LAATNCFGSASMGKGGTLLYYTKLQTEGSPVTKTGSVTIGGGSKNWVLRGKRFQGYPDKNKKEGKEEKKKKGEEDSRKGCFGEKARRSCSKDPPCERERKIRGEWGSRLKEQFHTGKRASPCSKEKKNSKKGGPYGRGMSQQRRK